MTTLPSPVSVADVVGRVRITLDTFLARQHDILADVAAEATPLVACITDLVSGGKRLRPAFCYWGWRGAGEPDCQEIVTAATALELFQAAALIHDDVMDDSATRRGSPAVHRRFAMLHREKSWLGDGERFGMAAAVLAGDLCLSWSDEMFSGSGIPAAALLAGRDIFDRMRTELMGGQYLDMLEQAMSGTGPDPVGRARRVIRYKSAKYSIEHPLLLGGRLAGAGPDLLDSYSKFGLPLGEAFQLRDDLLGVFGDPAQTGKPAGDDLREGKRTVLVAFALEWASTEQAATVRRLLGDPGLDVDGVDDLRSILTDTGATGRVETLIQDDVDEARKALAETDITPEARRAFEDLVTAATVRTA